MKNEKIIKRIRTYFCVLFLLLVCGFTLAFTKNKINASSINNAPVYEPNNIYAVDILEYEAPTHQIIFVMYVEDSFYLDYTTFGIHTRYYTAVAPYSYILSNYTDLTRNAGYDLDNGYEAYIYIFNVSGNYPIDITFDWSSATIRYKDTNNLYGWGNYYNATQVSYTIRDTYYQDGVQDGRAAGYQDGLRDGRAEYAPGTTGYENIFNAGKEASIDTTWLVSLWQSVDAFFAIELFNGITFGWLFGIPFAISVLWFIIRQFRGGGGD